MIVVLDEYVSTVWDVKREEAMTLNSEPWLQWIAACARCVTPRQFHGRLD